MWLMKFDYQTKEMTEKEDVNKNRINTLRRTHLRRTGIGSKKKKNKATDAVLSIQPEVIADKMKPTLSVQYYSDGKQKIQDLAARK